MATFATLVFVPTVFALLHGASSKRKDVSGAEAHALDADHQMAAGD